MNIAYAVLKRLLDVAFAALVTVVLLPFAIILAALIYVDDPGPVIFRQRRVGRFGREFVLLKFRTMRIGAPNISTEEMRRLGKSFHTRLGPFLRGTSLDELPQLWNVLVGDMSMVGPRPALPSQDRVNTLREAAGVHDLRPGITGLAQVMGRDDLDDATKVGYDAEYKRGVSISLDARVILLTVKAVVSAHGNH